MDLHEYQAKEILEKYSIPVPPYKVIRSLDEVEEVCKDLHLNEAVLKVQVHAGGRGKAGGVRFAKNPEEIRALAKVMLGMKIVNNQTGPRGLIAHQLLIAAPVEIAKEFYLGIVLDRNSAKAVLIASPEGGMEIEEIAVKAPHKMLKLTLPPHGNLRTFQLWKVVKFLDLPREAIEQGMHLIRRFAHAFIGTDALLFEINPLVLTKDNRLFALDAKLSVDDNALYRQKELASYFDATQMPENEVRAHEHGLSYISLDGNIGCMVNGAGLAMATMDIIQHFGGKPANFLDVGGSASEEKVSEGFKIILSDTNVKAILINIFGGIMNCQTLAAGIVAAAKDLQIKVPIVVRMEGTNVEQGRQTLRESGLPFIIAKEIDEAAQKAVKAASGA